MNNEDAALLLEKYKELVPYLLLALRQLQQTPEAPVAPEVPAAPVVVPEPAPPAPAPVAVAVVPPVVEPPAPAPVPDQPPAPSDHEELLARVKQLVATAPPSIPAVSSLPTLPLSVSEVDALLRNNPPVFK